MLSFSCEFPVKESNTQAFIDAVRRWVEGSPHTTFASSDLADIPSDGHWALEIGGKRLEALIASDERASTAGFRHVAVDGSIEWRTTVVYSRTDDDCWVGVRTDREADKATISLPPAKKPLLVRTLLTELGGGLDGELYCTDNPYYLKDNDIGMATRLINSDSDNYLPVVYISCDFSGKVVVNPVPLARLLGGMAHVLVEPDRNFSHKLQADVGSRNAYGGAVGVYWPTGESFKYLIGSENSSEFDVRRTIATRIRQALVNRRPLARCTWSRPEAAVARETFKKLRDSGSDDVQEYVDIFDAELQAKDRQLDEAETEVRHLQARIRKLDADRGSRTSKISIDTEQEFFPGEFAGIIRDALETAVSNARQNGRRRHGLSAFYGTLDDESHLKEKKNFIKRLLKDYTSMTKTVRDGLEDIGFSISEDGKHYKLTYMQDERYLFTLPKTGSDHRGGKNAASDIAKRIF